MGLDWIGEGHVGPGRAKVGRGNDAVRMARWEVGEAKKREGKKGGRAGVRDYFATGYALVWPEVRR